MSKEANVEHFEGALDLYDSVKGGQFVQAARIVGGEARYERGAFTFTGYTRTSLGAPELVLETGGRYERAGNIIRVFFDNPPDHTEEVSIDGLA